MDNRTKHPLYNVWAKMIRRCVDPRVKEYANYGARGIKVCNEWVDDFWTFVADMGPRPTPKHTVERIRNNGPYAPTNCRWATHAEQKLNTRRSRVITFRGKTLPVTEWARRVGLHPATVFTRLRNGCSPDVALTAAPIRGHVVGKPSLGDRLRAAGLTRAAYHQRIASGWTVEQALSTPRYHRRPR